MVVSNTGGFCAVIYQYRRYRTLKGDLSMVRERKDYYQLTKAVGKDPAPEVQLVAEEEPAGTGAAVEIAGRRKKKKAHRSRSTTEVEVETEVELEVEADPAPEVVSEVPAASSKKRTAREEVTPAYFVSLPVA